MKQILVLAALLAAPIPGLAAGEGSVEFVQVRGKSLEGNLSGDSPVREVAVYLPPSYSSDSDRRYPTVYLLHGFTDSVEKWWRTPSHWINLPTVLDKGMARDDVREMIVVMPDAHTRFAGSFYSSGATTGDWETYVAEEVVAYVDSHHRTIATPASRGLAGHSMGGYGTIRIGVSRPDVFSSLYALSACCLSPDFVGRLSEAASPAWERITTDAEFAGAPFLVKVVFSTAVAWAPNPANAPFFFDLPTQNGELQPAAAKIAANAPLAYLDQRIHALRSLKAVAFDAGDEERVIAPTSEALHDLLDDYEIDHEFEIYEGNHTNRIAIRIEAQVLPFFSTALEF